MSGSLAEDRHVGYPETRITKAPPWVLGTELRSSERTASSTLLPSLPLSFQFCLFLDFTSGVYAIRICLFCFVCFLFNIMVLRFIQIFKRISSN